MSVFCKVDVAFVVFDVIVFFSPLCLIHCEGIGSCNILLASSLNHTSNVYSGVPPRPQIQGSPQEGVIQGLG